MGRREDTLSPFRRVSVVGRNEHGATRARRRLRISLDYAIAVSSFGVGDHGRMGS